MAGGTHFFVVHSAAGDRQCVDLAVRLAGRGVSVYQEDAAAGPAAALSGLERSSAVILFLVDHFFEDPRVVGQVRAAVAVKKPLVLVYETRKSWGAPLNAQKNFDFARVFDEQAPADLNKLHWGLEGVPFHCGSERLRGAVVDALLAKALDAIGPGRGPSTGPVVRPAAEPLNSTAGGDAAELAARIESDEEARRKAETVTSPR